MLYRLNYPVIDNTESGLKAALADDVERKTPFDVEYMRISRQSGSKTG